MWIVKWNLNDFYSSVFFSFKVAGMFKDPTLEYPITVVLTRLVMLDTDEVWFDNKRQ